jgi:hypothetical protein
MTDTVNEAAMERIEGLMETSDIVRLFFVAQQRGLAMHC